MLQRITTEKVVTSCLSRRRRSEAAIPHPAPPPPALQRAARSPPCAAAPPASVGGKGLPVGCCPTHNPTSSCSKLHWRRHCGPGAASASHTARPASARNLTHPPTSPQPNPNPKPRVCTPPSPPPHLSTLDRRGERETRGDGGEEVPTAAGGSPTHLTSTGSRWLSTRGPCPRPQTHRSAPAPTSHWGLQAGGGGQAGLAWLGRGGGGKVWRVRG